MVCGTDAKGAACSKTKSAAFASSERPVMTLRLRERNLSSPRIASLRQWVRFSTPQCPRTSASHWAWERSCGLRLEM